MLQINTRMCIVTFLLVTFLCHTPASPTCSNCFEGCYLSLFPDAAFTNPSGVKISTNDGTLFSADIASTIDTNTYDLGTSAGVSSFRTAWNSLGGRAIRLVGDATCRAFIFAVTYDNRDGGIYEHRYAQVDGVTAIANGGKATIDFEGIYKLVVGDGATLPYGGALRQGWGRDTSHQFDGISTDDFVLRVQDLVVASTGRLYAIGRTAPIRGLIEAYNADGSADFDTIIGTASDTGAVVCGALSDDETHLFGGGFVGGGSQYGGGAAAVDADVLIVRVSTSTDSVTSKYHYITSGNQFGTGIVAYGSNVWLSGVSTPAAGSWSNADIGGIDIFFIKVVLSGNTLTSVYDTVFGTTDDDSDGVISSNQLMSDGNGVFFMCARSNGVKTANFVNMAPAVSGSQDLVLLRMTDGATGASSANSYRLNADVSHASTNRCFPNGIGRDGIGKVVYIAGRCEGHMTGSEAGTLDDAVLVKFADAGGAPLWRVSATSSSGDDTFRGVAAGSDGTVYVIGQTTGVVGFTSANAGGDDVFIQAYNSDGALILSTYFGIGNSSDDDRADCMTVIVTSGARDLLLFGNTQVPPGGTVDGLIIAAQ